MTQAGRKLLEEFDALPDGDLREVFAELPRRAALVTAVPIPRAPARAIRCGGRTVCDASRRSRRQEPGDWILVRRQLARVRNLRLVTGRRAEASTVATAAV